MRLVRKPWKHLTFLRVWNTKMAREFVNDSSEFL